MLPYPFGYGPVPFPLAGGAPDGRERPEARGLPPMLPLEESYIENILRLNRGKIATVYATYENNREWNAVTFRGTVEAAGRDHLILSDPQTGRRYLILMVNVDYITFDEPLEYIPPTMVRYAPR